MYTLGEGLWGVAGRCGVHIRGGPYGRGRVGGVHIRGGALRCGRERWCTHYRAYDKILRWPDNMSGHYIFLTDILKNAQTIIVISIFIVIIINMQVYMYCIHTVYQYNMRSYT